jgi:ribosome recycling factor
MPLKIKLIYLESAVEQQILLVQLDLSPMKLKNLLLVFLDPLNEERKIKLAQDKQQVQELGSRFPLQTIKEVEFE